MISQSMDEEMLKAKTEAVRLFRDRKTLELEKLAGELARQRMFEAEWAVTKAIETLREGWS